MNPQPFTIHRDKLNLLDELSNEEKGIILTALIGYHDTGEIINLNDRLLNTVFKGIAQSIDFMTEKYNKKKEANALNGKKGGRPKSQEENTEVNKPNKTDGFFKEPNKTDGLNSKPKKAITDTVTDTVTVTDLKKKNIKKKKESPEEKEQRESGLSEAIKNYTQNTELATALEDWMWEREKKKPLTIKAMELNLKKLDRFASSDAKKLELVEDAIAGQWLSFYDGGAGGKQRASPKNNYDKAMEQAQFAAEIVRDAEVAI